jgi:hypothetical protein
VKFRSTSEKGAVDAMCIVDSSFRTCSRDCSHFPPPVVAASAALSAISPHIERNEAN